MISSRQIFLATASISAICGIGLYSYLDWVRKPLLEVIVFAVDGGQSVLIRTPNDKRILINGGANSEIVKSVTRELPFFSRKIDYVVATNDKDENIAGLVSIISRYEVGEILVPNIINGGQKAYEEFLRVAETNKIKLTQIDKGYGLELEEGLYIQVLFPVSKDLFEYSKASSPEIVFKMTYNSLVFIFLGKTTKKIQNYIEKDLQITKDRETIVVVSSSASSGVFSSSLATKVQPKLLVYSKKMRGKEKRDENDPFPMILGENRFNVQKEGKVTIKTNGSDVTAI